MAVIISYIILLLFFSKKEPAIFKPALISSALLVFFHVLFFIEFQYGTIDYFISDERVYLNIGSSNQLNDDAIKDRVLWFYLTEFVERTDFTGGLFSKLISLPLVPVLIYLVFKISGTNKSLYVFLFLPYILFIMQTALRDSMILVLSVSFIYVSFNRERKFLIFGGVLLLFIFALRPFYIPLLLTAFIMTKYFLETDELDFRAKLFKALKYLLISIVISLVIYLAFKSKFDQYLRNISYYYEFGLNIDDEKTTVTPSFSLNYILYSFVRFVFTPLPTSLIDRMLTGTVTQFGYVDDFIRMINQSFLFLMLFYIISRPNALYAYFKSLVYSSREFCLLFFIFINTIVYSFYYAGGGHSRLKIAVFLGVFIIFNGVMKFNVKKEK
tara:strand:- start:8045 stop:9196 length:1152 start_codon:yes stop_codon:yes gene_type:complete